MIFFVAFLGGGVPVFAKIALKEVPIFSFIFITLFLSFLILLFVYFFGEKNIKFKINFDLFKLSIFPLINFILFAVGIRLTNPNIAQAISTLNPLFTFIFSFILIRKVLYKKDILAVIIGLIGTFLIIFQPLFDHDISYHLGMKGNIIIFFAMISLVLFNILSKKAQRKYKPIEIIISMLFFSSIAMFIFSIFENGGFLIKIDYSYLILFSIFYVGFFGTALYYLFYQKIIKKSSSLIASSVLYIQPFFTIIWSFFLIKEKVTFLFFISLMISLVGVFLLQKQISK